MPIRQTISDILYEVDDLIALMVDNFLDSHPEAETAPYVVFLIRDNKGKLNFSPRVGHKRINATAVLAVAKIIEGEIAREP